MLSAMLPIITRANTPMVMPEMVEYDPQLSFEHVPQYLHARYSCHWQVSRRTTRRPQRQRENIIGHSRIIRGPSVKPV